MDLSRFRAAPSARLSYLSFESDRAFPSEKLIATTLAKARFLFDLLQTS
jgi:hypothetical protein